MPSALGRLVAVALVGASSKGISAWDWNEPAHNCNEQMIEFALSPDGTELAELLRSRNTGCIAERVVVARLEGNRLASWRRVLRGKDIQQLKWIHGGRLTFIHGPGGAEVDSYDLASKTREIAVKAPGRIVNYEVNQAGDRVVYTYRLWQTVSDYVSMPVPDRMGVFSAVAPRWATVNGQFTGNGGGTTGVGLARLGRSQSEAARATHYNVYQLEWLGSPSRPVMLRQAGSEAIWDTSLIDIVNGRIVLSPSRLARMMRVAGSPSGLLAIAAAGEATQGIRESWDSYLYVTGGAGEIERIPGTAERSVFGMWWQGDAVLWAEVLSPQKDGMPMVRQLIKVDVSQHRIVQTIRFPNGNLQECKMTEDRTTAVCLAQTLAMSPRLVKVTLSSGSITVLNALGTPDRDLHMSFQSILVRNRFGRRTTGFLAVPATRRGVAQSHKGVPLAIMLYGFSETFSENGEWIQAYPVDKLVRAGIAVLMLNLPEEGTWQSGDVTAARFQLLENPLATVEAAPGVAAISLAQSGRTLGKVLIMGWSWGGFIAAHAIAQSCKFVGAEVGDPAQFNSTSYALYGKAWREWENSVFGGPPDRQHIGNYLEFDPAGSGAPPRGPVMLEFVSRNLDAGQFLQEWRAEDADVEAFAYHYSAHILDLPAEAEESRKRNLAWAKLNLLGRQSVSAPVLRSLGLTVPRRSSYRCHH